MPSRLLIQERGKGLRGEWALRLRGAVEELLLAADQAHVSGMKAAEDRLKQLTLELVLAVGQRGGLAVQDQAAAR